MEFDVQKIRADFPVLSRRVYGKPLVYFDNGATAQKPYAVIDKVDYLHREMNANVHRGLHFMSETCTDEYEAARRDIAAFIGGRFDARDRVYGWSYGGDQYGGV